jgi:hypothetical protein
MREGMAMIKAVLVIAGTEEGAVPLSGLPYPGDVLNAKLNLQWQKLRVMHTEHVTSDRTDAVCTMPRIHCVQIAETATDVQNN